MAFQQITLPLRAVDILREFTLRSERTQPELQSVLGISPPTAFRAVDQLRKLGLIEDGEGVFSDGQGRPATSLQLNPKGLCVFALAIRSDESHLYLVDALGKIHTSVRIPVSADGRYVDAVDRYAAEILSLLPEASANYALTPGVGISFAGSVDPDAGEITTPSRFVDWRHKPIAADLASRVELPCAVENDATALSQATLWFGSQPLPDSYVLLYIDFGLGTGYCFDGRPYRGHNYVASGLAHMNMFGWSQERCHCGRVGCLETVLSIPGVVKQAKNYVDSISRLSRPEMIEILENLERAAQMGELEAYQILAESGKKAGMVGSRLARMLDLGAVIFAGILTETSETFWKAIQTEMAQQVDGSTPAPVWWKLTDLLQNQFPEALGATAVAMANLYLSRKVTVLKEKTITG